MQPPVDLAQEPALVRFQAMAEQALGRRKGTVVALHVTTGRPLAVVHPAIAHQPRDPGSLAKVPLAWSALAKGRVSGDRELTCQGPPVCWRQHGRVDLARALGWSCSSYFHELEREGGPQWQRFHGWQPQTVTPWNVARFFRELLLDPSPAAVVLRNEMVAATRMGLARHAFPASLRVAGKTGTVPLTAGRTLGWFAGWSPASLPQILVVVMAEDSRGADGAAPIASRVFQAYRDVAP